jgi:hypothetical protein
MQIHENVGLDQGVVSDGKPTNQKTDFAKSCRGAKMGRGRLTGRDLKTL